MRNLLQNNVALGAAIAAAVFAVAAFFIPAAYIVTILSWANMIIAVAVLVTYRRVIIDTIVGVKVDYVGILSLGIALSWLGLGAMRLAILVSRGLGWSLVDTNVVSAYLYLSLLGGLLHIAAPLVRRTGYVKPNLLVLVISVSIVSMAVGITIGLYLGGALRWL